MNMRGISVGALLFAFLLNPTNVQAGDESPPFWKSKPVHRRRMYEERAILVSVRDEKSRVKEGELVRLTVKGAGVVS
ncbi:MAG: hypothetical protein NDI61_13335, partial [Bdellovibrionaceae bacterium]|nr:hypothetical protein [Pseudobdellovibrionaceae bacterium]